MGCVNQCNQQCQQYVDVWKIQCGGVEWCKPKLGYEAKSAAALMAGERETECGHTQPFIVHPGNTGQVLPMHPIGNQDLWE